MPTDTSRDQHIVASASEAHTRHAHLEPDSARQDTDRLAPLLYQPLTSSAACCRPKKQFFPQGGMPGRRQKDVQKQYGISHRRWNAYMKALHGNGSESDGWNSDVEREVSRETEEMRGEPQLQPESLPSLRARAEQVAALCEQSIASGQPVSRAQISALPAPGAADKACSECSNTNPNPNPSSSPGPDPDHSKRRKDTEKTKPAWYKIGCPFGHRSALTKTTGGGGTGVLSRRSYTGVVYV